MGRITWSYRIPFDRQKVLQIHWVGPAYNDYKDAKESRSTCCKRVFVLSELLKIVVICFGAKKLIDVASAPYN